MKRFGLINLVLLALIALAAWRTVDVWRRRPPEREVATDATAKAGIDPLPAPPRKPPIAQTVGVIADKDLFDASRKAPETSAPVPVTTPGPPPTLKLSGVILVGDQREALLLDATQGNRQLRMREGEEVSGYKVGRIQAEQISLLGSGGEEIVLLLEIEKGKVAKKGFGPGGKPAAQAQPGKPGGPLQPKGPAPGAPQPAEAEQMQKRPPGGIVAGAQTGDARQRAEAARERLKRLRAEAAAQ